MFEGKCFLFSVDMENAVPALRVSQLDAATLDREIDNILIGQWRKVLDHFIGFDLSWLEPEFEAALKAVIWFYVFRRDGATVGQKMMDMSYRIGNSFPVGNRVKSIYFFVIIALPWLRQRAASIFGWNNENRKYRIERTLENYDTLLAGLNILHFLWFLGRGGFWTVWERVLGLRAVHNSQPSLEEMDVDLTERELLWHGFSDLLVFFLPLINYRRLYNRVIRIGKTLGGKSKMEMESGKRTQMNTNILSPCVYCQQNPPISPCHPGCGHVYCYFCLAANLEADKNYACVICGYGKSDKTLVFVRGDAVEQ